MRKIVLDTGRGFNLYNLAQRPDPRSGRPCARLSRLLSAFALLLCGLHLLAAAPAVAQTVDVNIVSLSTRTPVVVEGNIAHTRVDLSKAAPSDAKFPIALTLDTAEAEDFDTQLTYPIFVYAGHTGASTSFHTNDDDCADELFTASIRMPLPSGYALGETYSVQITIRDDDECPPTNLTVTPGDRRLTLRWTAPDLPGNTVLTGYEVQYKDCEKPRRPASQGSIRDSQGRLIFHNNRQIWDPVNCAEVPWTNHGAWASSQDPLARQTTRVIDGLIPGVAYKVQVRALTFRCTALNADKTSCATKVRSASAYVNATATPSGGSGNARLRQLDLQQ